MTGEQLEQKWRELSPTGGSPISGKRVPGLSVSNPIYLAVDAEGRRQLVVAVGSGTEAAPHRPTKGLEVTIEQLQIGESTKNTYVRLVNLLPVHNKLFAALAAEIINAIGIDPADPRATAFRCIDRWRSFFTIGAAPLSKDEALGLFGELWFMYRWISPLNTAAIEHWQGPLSARHDFQWPFASVEVKTSASGSAGAPVHCITSLDQLAAPEVGQLYLFSLHVTDDSLANNSLQKLVNLVQDQLQRDLNGTAKFIERLEALGYDRLQSDAYCRPLRVLSEGLYLVDKAFPRITRETIAGLPPAISDVSYLLSMDGCAAWKIATSPSDATASFLRQ